MKQHCNHADISKPSLLACRWRAVRVTAVLVGMLSVAGTSYAGAGMGHGMHRHHTGEHAAMTPEQATRHISQMIDRMVPDATADQKTRLSAILKSAFDDLRPLREQHRAQHVEAARLLSQRTIDRTALERTRAAKMQAAEQVSRRITQALADAAEVLTPDQRAVAAERLQKRMERMR